MDKEKIIFWLMGVLTTAAFTACGILYNAVTDNALAIAKLQGEVVTRDALNGRLDKLDQKIEKLADSFQSYMLRIREHARSE